ncbi:site-specific integrase [Alicyclobacillus macrosporangiidus]|jgi:integrase|uniref:Site-specific recombinase XerD n=1 Tax=Alicyclobacillus macrosporangiidus TaxID=392015 RepID=A0A1I7FSY6_9BACL|nr:site-specific integrase [Alicyclobacillus macrosporangiidus]SFU39267.1 Site-specific recombinase XerD [Alicyclobacillus macrosporangiidus]
MKGHLRKRGSKWCFVLDVGKDENGKRIRKWFSGYATKREAEKAMASKIVEIESGGYVVAPKETVGTYLRRWLDDKRPQVAYNTYRKYEWLVCHHIIPKLGHIGLQKLTPSHLQKFYTDLRSGEAALSARSTLHAHRIIHEALDRAVKWGLVSRNVADAVEPPRADRYQASVWTAEQAAYFIEQTRTTEPRCWAVFVLAITTGMRKTEILGLQWTDVDMERGYISIQRTLDYVKKQPVVKELKTDRSRRYVALPSLATEALGAQRALQAQDRLLLGPDYKVSDWVFTNEIGEPLSPNTVNTAWYRALRSVDVPRIRFHDLRHTHASLLLKQGVNPKVVSERLGHATVQITLDTYSHVLPGLQRDAADRFDELLRKRAPN